MRNFLLILGGLFIGQYGFCQVEKNSIDVEFDACMENWSSSYDMVVCISDAMEKWNQKLDSTYHDLLSKSDSTTQHNLMINQKNWQKYVKSKIQVWESFNAEGMSKTAAAGWDYDRLQILISLTRARIEELEGYYQYLEE